MQHISYEFRKSLADQIRGLSVIDALGVIEDWCWQLRQGTDEHDEPYETLNTMEYELYYARLELETEE